MLVTLIPFFDKNMKVAAYSVFSRKKNKLLHPELLGTGHNDGAGYIEGLELIQSIGVETLAPDTNVFVPVNNIAIFSNIKENYQVNPDRIVLLFDDSVLNSEMYLERITELKKQGYKLAIRKIQVADYEPNREFLMLMDYVILNCHKVEVNKAKIYFKKVYPELKICVGNIDTQEFFEEVKDDSDFCMFEGEFYRVPINRNNTEVAPLKMNYISLLNIVNEHDFDLTKAASIIERDMALALKLLELVNHMTVNSQITSIRYATAMLGQKELKRWINTAVARELCDDRPSEVARLSLIRAKFAEELAGLFGQKEAAPELFLLGLFSDIDLVLDMPMEEALKRVNLSEEIKDALIRHEGSFAPLYEFMLNYEAAHWEEISRVMVLNKITVNDVYEAYHTSLKWYKDIIMSGK